MNKIITFVALCIMAMSATAQDKADIEVSYSFEFPNFKTGERTSRNQYILLANANQSKFYSPRTEYVDSMQSTPDGQSKLQEMQRAAILAGNFNNVVRRDGSFYVYKSNVDNSVTHYDVAGTDHMYSVEDKTPIDWELTDSTKTVLGYECILATADYHGRKWNVWFTPEIPLQEGPWKFYGLPGFILEAESVDGQYLFTATGINATDKPITPIYLSDQYEKLSRVDLWKAKRTFLDNPLGNINVQTGGNVQISVKDENGNNLSLNQASYINRDQVDFLETDY